MVYSACIFRIKYWERAGYISAHRGKVYYTKALLSVTEEDRRCPEVICSVAPNSSGPSVYNKHFWKFQMRNLSVTLDTISIPSYIIWKLTIYENSYLSYSEYLFQIRNLLLTDMTRPVSFIKKIRSNIITVEFLFSKFIN